MEATSQWQPPNNLKVSSGPILLVWSRFSGQNEDIGYNPGGDSDPNGQIQLLELGTKAGFNVFTIGHGPTGGRAPVDNSGRSLGEFYNNEPIKAEGRAGQISFFLALKEKFPGDIVQLGQKSGGMDAAALLGIPTIYIEDKKSPNPERMKEWINTVPGYHRAFIDEPPSPLGRALRKMPSSIEGSKTAKVPPDVRILAWVWLLTTAEPKGNPDQEASKKENLTRLKEGAELTLPVESPFEKWVEKIPEAYKTKESALREWLKSMQLLNPDQLQLCGIPSGYGKDDLEKIKQELDGIKTANPRSV
jgi:hypothetical protein